MPVVTFKKGCLHVVDEVKTDEKHTHWSGSELHLVTVARTNMIKVNAGRKENV